MHRPLYFALRLRLGLLVLLVTLGTLTGNLLLVHQPSRAAGVSSQPPPPASFAAPVAYPTGSLPSAIATTDLTGKGHTDVVTANYGDGTVSVLLGKGDGTLAPAVSYAADSQASAVTIADVNGDHIPDIVTANQVGDVSILLGNGNGTFKPPVQVQIPGGYQPSGVAVHDLNGDGKADLVVADGPGINGNGPSGASVLFGNGDGTFQSPVFYASGNTYQKTNQIIIADFTGDHIPDLAVIANNCAYGNGQISILPGHGDGTFGNPIVTMESCMFSTAASDVNRDGKLDIVAVLGNSPVDSFPTRADVLLGNGDGTFTTAAEAPTAPEQQANGVAIGDFNLDGKLDAVLSDHYPGNVSLFLGNGDGTLQPVTNLDGEPNNVPVGIASADLNGDGKPDIIVVNRDYNEITVRLNTTINQQPGTQQPPVGAPVTPGENGGSGNPSDAHCPCQGSAGQPINTATGNFWHSFTDIAIPGRGILLDFSHTYNTQAAGTNGPLGYGWSFPYGMSLAVTTTTATITQENGSQVTFTTSGSTFTPTAPRELAALVKNPDGTYTFTRRSREIFTFNSSGQLTQEKDLNGYSTTLSYTGSQLMSVADAAGRHLTIGWTGSNITSVTDPIGRKVIFGYNDGAGNLTDVTDVGGGNEHFTYYPNHLLFTMRDPRGNTVTNHYDSSGRVDWQTDQLNRKTSLAYTTSGSSSTTTITDPSGHVTYEQYMYGLRVAMTKGYGTRDAATWKYLYDPSTLGMISVTDPKGQTSSALYDARGNQLTSTDALKRTTTNTYDSLDDLLSTKDPLGITTRMKYDAVGNLLSRSRPLSGTTQKQVTTFKYTDLAHPGDVTQIIDANGNTWKLGYDTYGDLVTSIDPLGDKSTSTYNTIGWKLKTVSPKGYVSGNTPVQFTTKFGHDPFGRVNTVTDPLGHTSTWHFDPNGNNDTFTDADGKKTTYVYDPANERTITTRADGTTVQTTYNSDGTVYQQIDGKGKVTTYKYDPLARVKSTTDPVGRITLLAYDAAGNRRTLTDPQGQVTTYGYDTDHELTSITYSDGKTPNVSNIKYDADGQRKSMTDGVSTSTWTWDSLHRMTQSNDGLGGAVTYGYDLADHLTSMLYPGQSTPVKRTYDPAGRLHTVTDWFGNTTTLNPDADSNPGTIVFPTGTNVTDTYTFDRADQLKGISDAEGGTPFATFAYQRDNAGQVTKDTPTGVPSATHTYGYSPLNQVCYDASPGAGTCASPPKGSKPYTYDAADNLTQLPNGTVQAYDDANELCWTLPSASSNACSSPPAGATTYGYDKRGNRTSMTPPSGSPTTLSYDQANRLTAYGSDATYIYNGDGLRVKKVVSGTTYRMVWNQAQGLPLLMQDGTAAYIYGMGGQLLERVSGNTVSYYHTDQLGSVRTMTDSSGNVLNTYSYDTYGNVTGSTGTSPNTFKFAGEYQDNESGMYYLRARYYDPSTGQFISRDTLVAMTRSAYAYVAGNPLNGTDPTGLCWGPGCWVLDRLHEHGLCTINETNCGHSVAADIPVVKDVAKATYDFGATNTFGVCAGGNAGVVYGRNGQACLVFNNHSLGYTTTTGSGFQTPSVGFSGGPLWANTGNIQDFQGPFNYLGTSGTPFIVPSIGGQGDWGTGVCGQPVHVAGSSVGLGFTPFVPFEVHAGTSNTDVHVLLGG